jgi:multiple sugar transport system permease protein
MKQQKIKRAPVNVLMQIFAVALVIVMLFPLLWTFSLSLRDRRDVAESRGSLIPADPTMENWHRVFEQMPVGRAIGNSLTIGIASTVLAVILGTLTGYGLAQLNSSKQWLFWLLSPRLVPAVVLAVPLFLLVRNFDLLNTPLSLIIAHTTMVLPFAVLIMRDHFVSLPRAFAEAARIDGAGVVQVFQRVALPNARAALIGTALVCFIFSYNDSLYPLVLTNSVENFTLPLMMLQFQRMYMNEAGLVAASAVFLVALPAVLSLFLNRYVFTALSLGIVED